MLSATDPSGRFVVLTEETYNAHIAPKHPDIVPDWIVEVIEEPDIIAQSFRKKQRICYYKRGILPPAYGQDYLKVVIRQRALGKTSYVCTAFPARRIKPEERIIWKP